VRTPAVARLRPTNSRRVIRSDRVVFVLCFMVFSWSVSHHRVSVTNTTACGGMGLVIGSGAVRRQHPFTEVAVEVVSTRPYASR
jgi:hypothetical protein